jgi:hypothetical protein
VVADFSRPVFTEMLISVFLWDRTSRVNARGETEGRGNGEHGAQPTRGRRPSRLRGLARGLSLLAADDIWNGLCNERLPRQIRSFVGC